MCKALLKPVSVWIPDSWYCLGQWSAIFSGCRPNDWLSLGQRWMGYSNQPPLVLITAWGEVLAAAQGKHPLLPLLAQERPHHWNPISVGWIWPGDCRLLTPDIGYYSSQYFNEPQICCLYSTLFKSFVCKGYKGISTTHSTKCFYKQLFFYIAVNSAELLGGLILTRMGFLFNLSKLSNASLLHHLVDTEWEAFAQKLKWCFCLALCWA